MDPGRAVRGVASNCPGSSGGHPLLVFPSTTARLTGEAPLPRSDPQPIVMASVDKKAPPPGVEKREFQHTSPAVSQDGTDLGTTNIPDKVQCVTFAIGTFTKDDVVVEASVG